MTKSTNQLLWRVGITAGITIVGYIVAVLLLDTTSGPMQGEELYATHCGNCHGKEGQGFRSLYPPLAGSDYLKEHQAELPCIIHYGMNETIVVNGKNFAQPMLGLPDLKTSEVVKITNYVLETWVEDAKPVTNASVEKELTTCGRKMEEAAPHEHQEGEAH